MVPSVFPPSTPKFKVPKLYNLFMKNKLASTLLVFSFGLLLSACNKTAPNTSGQMENKNEVKEESFNKKSTLKTLLGMGKNLTCTYNNVDEETKFEIKGTTYISGNKFAQEMETTDPKDKTKKVLTNMISDGEFVYTWSSDKKTSGMKIKMEKPETAPDGDVKTDVAGTDQSMNKEYDMNCNQWNIDESKFKVPTDVKFTDLSEIMKNIPTMPALPQIPE